MRSLRCIVLGGAFVVFLTGASTASTVHRYRLRMAGQEVGTAGYTVRPEKNSLITDLQVQMRLKQSGQAVEVELKGRLETDRESLLPLAYWLTVFTNGARQADIQVMPDSDSVRVAVEAPGLGKKVVGIRTEPGTLILDNNFCMDHYQMMLWKFHRTGADSARYPFVVPQIALQMPRVFHITLKTGGLDTIAIGDTTLICRRIDSQSDAGLSMQFWVDPGSGLLRRWTVPAQLTEVVYDFRPSPLDTSSASLDLNRYYRHLIDRLYLRAYVDLGDWKRLAYLRLRCKLDILGLGEPVRSTPWQRFEGEVTQADGRISYDGIFAIEMVQNRGEGEWLQHPPDSLRPYLAAELAAQSDAPEIRALADSLRRGCRSPGEYLRRVCGWVHEHIHYEITGGDALTCLRSRKGDCGPQSYLAIALLRAGGIPARIAGGLLYTGGRFGQHNWVEAYLGGETGWVPADPTTGEVDSFSAAHVTLWRGWAGALHPEPRHAEVEVLEFRKTE